MERLTRRHGTAVAYVALFIALGGTGWAATDRGAVLVGAARAKPAAVKVHCSATSRGKRVKCSVVGLSLGLTGARGPQGPRGPQGVAGTTGGTGGAGGAGSAGGAGPAGPSGPTVLTQQPGWTVLTGNLNNLLSPSGDEIDMWNVTNVTNASQSGTATVATYLLSPSQLSGSTAHLASVTFCYGTDTSRQPSAGTGMTITEATAVQADEPAASATGTYFAPAYTSANLIDAPLSLTNQAGCQTVSAPSPVAVDPSGFIRFVLTVSYKIAVGNMDPQVTLQLGRVTTTYTP
jgi:hypothetical protein